MPVDPQPRYQIPTHLNTPDKLDLPLFGITVSLTMRQGVCFLLGGSLVFHLWQQSFGMGGLSGLLAHWVVPFLLALTTYVLAVHEFRGRHLEAWMLLVMHYHHQPKVFVWCSVLRESMMAQAVASSEEAHDQTNRNDGDEEENEEL